MEKLEEIVLKGKEYYSKHSILVADAARLIAKKCNLDSNKAYRLGLLHDIGRMYHQDDFSHLYLGYKLLSNYDLACARICITHAYPLKNIDSFNGKINDLKMKEFVMNFINSIEYDSYDLLIQLCDAITTDKYITIEERYECLKNKNKWNDYSLLKINKLNEIKKHFDLLIKDDIYRVLYILN